jgi:hypothetical protein
MEKASNGVFDGFCIVLDIAGVVCGEELGSIFAVFACLLLGCADFCILGVKNGSEEGRSLV